MFRRFCSKMNFNNLQHYRGQKREQKGQKRENSAPLKRTKTGNVGQKRESRVITKLERTYNKQNA